MDISKHTMDNYLYRTLTGMKQRCYNKNLQCYKNYGGRGIKVCDRWLGENGFDNFLLDMGPRPTEEKDKKGKSIWSIDRIDVNGDYCPENCRWADNKTQHRNMTINTFLMFDGKPTVLAEIAERTGIKGEVIQSRISRGWSVYDATHKPLRRKDKKIEKMAGESGIKYSVIRKRLCRGWTDKEATSKDKNIKRNTHVYEINGELKTLSAICKERGLKYPAVARRVDVYGWSIERAINTPIKKLSPYKRKD